MKYYIDEAGNRYLVDRETGEKTLIQSVELDGEAGAPETAETSEDK